MSKREKLRRKLRNNPAQANMQEVETLLFRFGFILARIVGSHHIYEYEGNGIFQQIVIPFHGRQVKTVYVRRAVEIIDALFPEDTGDDGDE